MGSRPDTPAAAKMTDEAVKRGADGANAKIDTRFDHVDYSINLVNSRLDGVNFRLDVMNSRFPWNDSRRSLSETRSRSRDGLFQGLPHFPKIIPPRKTDRDAQGSNDTT